ncbi:MAG TPA: hypothetical protein VGJ86_02130 [Acidimicrobiales bacterium]|jgi:hypothetical protein
MSRPQRRRTPKKGRQPAAKQADTFWKDGGEGGPRAAEPIRPTPDPAALPRSLGEPPLTPDTAAPHHFAVVYEEAVRTATALAAANGLLRDDESD